MIRTTLLSIAYIVCLCACNGGSASGQNKQESGKTIAITDETKEITLPAIPSSMTDIRERADFLVRHYWDYVDLADTNCLRRTDVMEQAWVNYCDLLNHVPLTTAQEAMQATMEEVCTERKMLDYFADLADKYLYDPNSPLRNEEYYIPVLEVLIATPTLTADEKIRHKAQLELAMRNRIGTKAIDFTYTLVDGKQGKLYDLKADYTLLFINNPGCHACTETIETLQKAETICRLVDEQELIILSLYPDEDLNEWRKHLADFPDEWLNSYDKSLTISNEELYDLKAIPTLYLLDADKTVLLKDAPAQAIEAYLRAQGY